MAQPGDRVSVADFVEWLEFREISPEVLRYEICFRPRAILTREHVHRHQIERHEVVSGRLRLRVDGAVQTLTEGQAVVVPAGVRHAILPADEREVRMLFELRPALRWETLIETAGRLSEQRRRNWRGYVNPLLLALLAIEYRSEIYATRPPVPVQDVLLRPLAGLARRLGYDRRHLQRDAS